MTVLGFEAASRLPRLAKLAAAESDAARLPQSYEYVSRWLAGAQGLSAAEVMSGECGQSALEILAVLSQLGRHADAHALLARALEGLPPQPGRIRASFELFRDAMDLYGAKRPWHEVRSSRLAYAPPITTGIEVDVVDAALRSAWASLDDDDAERASTHTRAAVRALRCPAAWPMLMVAHVVALTAAARTAELASLRARELAHPQWRARLVAHPAFLSPAVAVAEMVLRVWVGDGAPVDTAGAPPESADRVRAFRAATGELTPQGALNLDLLRSQTRRARHGSLLAEALYRARAGDDAGARTYLEEAYAPPIGPSMFPITLAVLPWPLVEPLLRVADTMPQGHPARRVLAVADYPVHRGHS